MSQQPPSTPGPVPGDEQSPGSPPSPPPGSSGAAPPPAAPTRRNRTALVVVAAVVLVVVGIGAWALLSGDDGGGPGSPEEAVARLVDAMADGDCEALFEVLLVPDEYAGDEARFVEECEETLLAELGGDEVPVEVLSTSVDEEGGDRVTVEVEFRARGGEEGTSDPIPVVRRDGRWLVDTVSGMGLGDEGSTDTGTDDAGEAAPPTLG